MLQHQEQKKSDIFSDLGIFEIISSLKMLQRRLMYYAGMGSQMKKIVLSNASGI
jgi:hypothetical protein